MIKIDINIIKKIKELKKISDYINIIVDYKKEKEYLRLKEEIDKLISYILSESKEELIEVVEEIDDNTKELYLYDSDDIIHTLFNDNLKKDKIIISAYNWIDERQRVNWIENNVLCLASNKILYGKVFNINDRYILSCVNLNNYNM